MPRTPFFLLLFLIASSAAAQASDAHLYNFKGDVFILKVGKEEWFPAEKGKPVSVGDQFWVGENSSAEIALDAGYKNLIQIQKNTKVEIRNLTPVDIFLEDGSVFSALDHLLPGDSYQITTENGVSSVRGTHFYADFNKQDQKSQFALMPREDNRESQLLVKLKNEKQGTEEVILKEGQQATISKEAEEIKVESVPPAKEAEEKILFQQLTREVEQVKKENSSKQEDIQFVFVQPGSGQNYQNVLSSEPKEEDTDETSDKDSQE